MKKILITGLFINIICFATPAFATPPTQASLQKLAEIQHYRADLLKGMKKGFISAFQKVAMSSPYIASLSETKKQRVVRLNEEISQQMLQEINTPEFSQKITNMYLDEMAKTYTQEEVDTMMNFPPTSIEQSNPAKENAMLAGFTKKVEKGELISMAELQNIRKKYLPIYQYKLNKILSN